MEFPFTNLTTTSLSPKYWSSIAIDFIPIYVIGTGAEPIRLAKYSAVPRFRMQDIADPATALNIDPTWLDCPAAEKYKSIVNQSISKATWQKYSSGLQAFAVLKLITVFSMIIHFPRPHVGILSFGVLRFEN